MRTFRHTPMTRRNEFSKIQSQYFEAADEKRFRHQTSSPYLVETERALLDSICFQAGERLLEVGCGEGGNLFLLDPSQPKMFGVDLFHSKLEFARRTVPNCCFACSTAEALPFPDGTFDVVLCRDVLHHLLERAPALKEMWRVCRRGGRIALIEPNGRNPMMHLQSRLIRAEALIRRNTPDSLQDFLEQNLGAPAKLSLHQPLPFFRLVLHQRFGLPRLGRFKIVRALFDGIDHVAGRILPRSYWGYLVFEVKKR